MFSSFSLRQAASYPMTRLQNEAGATVLLGVNMEEQLVYIDKRELKCACVGGDSNVPLGAVSLTENLAMIGMGLWMLLAAFGAVPMPL